MPRWTDRAPTFLFPDEAEVARLILDPKRAKVWPERALILEAVTDRSEVGDPAEEQDAEGDEMQSGQSGGQALVVTSQSAETGHPSNGVGVDPFWILLANSYAPAG